MKKIIIILLVGAIIKTNVSAQPGAIDPTFNTFDDEAYWGNGWGANSDVNSISIQSDGKIIIGGAFNSYNGSKRNGIARLKVDGSLDTTFNPGTGFNSTVQSISIQRDGKIIVGGNFTSFNGITQNYITRLNADGSIDSSFKLGNGFNSTVQSISIQRDGKIIVGGNFTKFNGTAQSFITRLNTDGSIDASFLQGGGFNDRLQTINIQTDGKIIVGGFFTMFKGKSTNGIVRLNDDGSLDTTFNTGTGFTGYQPWVLTTSIQNDGKIIVGGSFSNFNGKTRNTIVRLNADGSEDVSFNPGSGFQIKQSYQAFTNGSVQTISIQTDGKIIVGGNFNHFNGVQRFFYARLKSDGSLDSPLDFKVGGISYQVVEKPIKSIEIQTDGKIILGAEFVGIGRLNSDGSHDVSFNGTGFNGSVECIKLQSDGKIIVGGNFTSFNGIAQNYIARLNMDGSLDTSFRHGNIFNGAVKSISIQPDGKIIVGGNFRGSGTSLPIKGNHIVRLNSDGSQDFTFNTGSGFDATVTCISVQADGKIVVGGYFTTFDGNAFGPYLTPYIACLKANGSLDTSFNKQGTQWEPTPYAFDGPVLATSILADGKIIVGGSFTSYNGTKTSGVACLKMDGSLNTSFNHFNPKDWSLGGITGTVSTIGIQADGKIVVGGELITYSYNGMGYGIARYNKDCSLDTTFKMGQGFRAGGYNGIVNTIGIQKDGKIIVGGFISSYNGKGTGNIARLNDDGSLDSTFLASFNHYPKCVDIQTDGKIIVGGLFTSYTYGAEATLRTRIARLLFENCSLNATASNVGLTLTATPSSAKYQWFDCSTEMAITGATGQQYIATASGSYGCWVTSGACKDTTNCVVVNIANSTIELNQSRVQVFPNPSSGFVNISIPEKATMVLHDVNGRIIKTYMVEAGSHSITLNDVNPGVYYANFTTDLWQITKKIILNPY
jgi:uncharacterized delta-60 repeat protein